MSVASTALVWECSRATGNARLVLLAIADHDGEGGAWPSVATLARMAGITPRNVQKHLETLVALGEIVVHKNQGGTLSTARHMRPNRYEITLARPVDNRTPDPLSVATPPVGSDTPPPVGSDTPPPVGSDTRTTPRTTQGTTPQPPTVDPKPPEALARLWGGEGINEDEQDALWALLVADPETLMPLHRGKQPAWIVWALAQVRAKARADTGAAVRQLRQYGVECEHGTPAGTSEHPSTGLPLCPLCRSKAAAK